MTSVTVHAGTCGFDILITVERENPRHMSVTITAECPMIVKFAETVSRVEWMTCLKNAPENPVLTASYACISHAGCPVPAGLIKAIEAEAGIALCSNSGILFTG